MRVTENISLADRTTIKTGGRARYLVSCENEAEIREALFFAAKNKLPSLVLGGGSNLLVSDHDFPGVVLSIEILGTKFGKNGLVTVGAGVTWDQFVAATVSEGLAGVESLSGIPGKSGATPIQNVGAYGQEVRETIVSVKALNRESGAIRIFSNAECAFGYRDSIFKRGQRDLWIILEVSFQLDADHCSTPNYAELRSRLESETGWQTANHRERLELIRNAVLEIRRAKGMVLDANDRDTRSLGSYFMNPIISAAEKDRLISVAAAKGIEGSVPVFKANHDMWKVSAAWLIERSGVKKGFELGGARVSGKHVLAITNPGGATTSAILKLEAHIAKSVADAFGIRLQREPVLITTDATI